MGIRTNEKGVTIIELMIVVVIIGVLAAVAIPAYKRYIKKAHAAEVPMIFAELASKEEAYKAENNRYLPTGAAFPATIQQDNPTVLGALPANWTALRINVPKTALYCQYEVFAGAPTGGTFVPAQPTDPTGTSTWGPDLYPAVPTRAWFYMVATCDWESTTGNSTYAQRGDQSQLFKDDGR